MSKVKRKKKGPQMSEKELKKIRLKQIVAFVVVGFIIITLILPYFQSLF